MSDPTKKSGAPEAPGGDRSQFEDFFGSNRSSSRNAAKALLQEFDFASETDEESALFLEPEMPVLEPAEEVQPETEAAAPARPEPIRIETVALMEARRRVNEAQSVQEITDACLAYAGGIFKRTGIFISRAPHLDGWDATGNGWSRQMIRKVHIPLDQPSIFQLFQQGAGYYLGPIPKTEVNDAFVRATGGKRPKSSLIIPILVGKRVVNLLYADNGHASEIDRDFSELLLFVLAVSRSYERLIRQKRQHTGR